MIGHSLGAIGSLEIAACALAIEHGVIPPTANLQKGDDGLLRLKSGGKAPTDETVTVSSGVLESSNVNAAQSLVNMIELQRLYEFQIKSINSTDADEQSAERMMLTS